MVLKNIKEVLKYFDDNKNSYENTDIILHNNMNKEDIVKMVRYEVNGIIENKVNELKNFIFETIGKLIISNSSLIATNNNNNHSFNKTNNQQINLNMFLNDTCKDALNINEFVDLIQFDINHVDDITEEGFKNYICRIITEKLDELGVKNVRFIVLM